MTEADPALSHELLFTPLKELASLTGIRSAGRTFESPPEGRQPDGPPGAVRGLANEGLAAAQVVRLIASAPRLATTPRGDGSTVIDMPGWKAPESSMAPIRAYLRWLGYDARTWGLGANAGNPERDAALMADHVIERAAQSGRPVALVGWSLGGVVAREVARAVPQAVSKVVTFGSPIIGGPTHTFAARSYSPAERDRIEELIEETDRENPLYVPVTAIFTRRDGVVNWRACIDRRTEGVRHIEVKSSHLGLGIDPDVWQAVAEALAA